MAFLDETGLAELWKLVKQETAFLYKHTWRRRVKSYTEVKTAVTSNHTIATEYSNTVNYSSSIVIDGNGNVSLANPSSITLDMAYTTAYTNLAAKAPCYITSSNLNGVYYLPSGTYGSQSNTATLHLASRTLYFGFPTDTTKKASKVTTVMSYGEPDFLFSDNRNAYPDSGMSSGYEYEYLGVPYENLLTAPSVEVGAYTGTGGTSATLTFEFAPKFVYISGLSGSTSHMLLINGMTNGWSESTSSNSNYSCTLTWSGNTLTWSNSKGANYMLNSAGGSYKYVAIG